MNLYGYVGNDPLSYRDPLGLDRVCASQTGTRIQSCVSVDANGDGETGDDDLNANQERAFSRDFREFIIRSNGRDISEDGLPVMGGTEHQQAMARTTSQFIGAAASGEHDPWFGARYIQLVDSAGMERLRRGGWVPGYSSSNTFGYADYIGGIINLNRDWSRWFDNPSWLARGILHERQHFMFGPEFGVGRTPGHQLVDSFARSYLRSYGLAGGGCPAVGGVMGIYPTYPGCN